MRRRAASIVEAIEPETARLQVVHVSPARANHYWNITRAAAASSVSLCRLTAGTVCVREIEVLSSLWAAPSVATDGHTSVLEDRVDSSVSAYGASASPTLIGCPKQPTWPLTRITCECVRWKCVCVSTFRIAPKLLQSYARSAEDRTDTEHFTGITAPFVSCWAMWHSRHTEAITTLTWVLPDRVDLTVQTNITTRVYVTLTLYTTVYNFVSICGQFGKLAHFYHFHLINCV